MMTPKEHFEINRTLRITDSPKTEMMHSFIPKYVEKTPLLLLKDEMIFGSYKCPDLPMSKVTYQTLSGTVYKRMCINTETFVICKHTES